jgi:excisionase family DNA binding protein
LNQAEVAGDWLTPAQAARTLQISVGTVYSLISQGRMPGPVRLGNQWRISRKALLAAAQPWGSSVD